MLLEELDEEGGRVIVIVFGPEEGMENVTFDTVDGPAGLPVPDEDRLEPEAVTGEPSEEEVAFPGRGAPVPL